MSSSFSEFLLTAQQDVEQSISACLAELPADPLREAMEYSVLNGGKRIRAALCYAAAEIFGGTNDLTHRSAAALEIIHAYSLIHDDLPAMDDDDLRRGKPSCHVAFGEATAILAGDALQTLAFDILAQAADTSTKVQVELIKLLATAAGARGMVLGQSLDLAAVDQTLNYEQLAAMHRHKTGALINASISMGAISCGETTAADMLALSHYGYAIGLAFQVKDDILDVESSTETLGKKQGSDQAQNKPTYSSLLGLDAAKHKLAELHANAVDATAHFGNRGNRLHAIADFIVQRSH